jgi:hypothetical protein
MLHLQLLKFSQASHPLFPRSELRRFLIQIFLESREYHADLVRLAQVSYRVGNGVMIFEAK